MKDGDGKEIDNCAKEVKKSTNTGGKKIFDV